MQNQKKIVYIKVESGCKNYYRNNRLTWKSR